MLVTTNKASIVSSPGHFLPCVSVSTQSVGSLLARPTTLLGLAEKEKEISSFGWNQFHTYFVTVVLVKD